MVKESRAGPTPKCSILKHDVGDTNYSYLFDKKSVSSKSIAKVLRPGSLNHSLNHRATQMKKVNGFNLQIDITGHSILFR